MAILPGDGWLRHSLYHQESPDGGRDDEMAGGRVKHGCNPYMQEMQ